MLNKIIKNFLKILIIFVSFVGIIFLIILFGIFFSQKIYIEKEVFSPDGEYKAVIFVRDQGGAAGGIYTDISILKRNKSLKKWSVGNIFSARYCEVEDIIWKDNNNLVVVYKGVLNKKPIVKWADGKINKINIIYIYKN